MLTSLSEDGPLARLVAEGAIDPAIVEEALTTDDPERLAELLKQITGILGNGREFLDSLEPEEREEFQEQVLHAYMQRAKNDEDAAFMLELLPTDTDKPLGQVTESLGDALIKGQGANDFRVGDMVGKIRQGAVTMADSLRERGNNVYALPVPYANTIPNIIGRTGTPSDGADHLHNYLEHLGPDMTTVTTGYSQGGAAVMDYVARYGDQDGLDYALALAPMGGADQHGGEGVYSGEMNGVSTLGIMNSADPAKRIHGDYLVDLLDPMLTFVSGGKQEKQGLDGSLHSGYYGDPSHPLPEGVDPLAAMAAGTMGYPTAYVEHMIGDMFDDRLNGQEYKRRGDWDFDLRDELLQNGMDGKPLDPTRLRRDGRQVANEYLP
jgi:pimeloyl-ACP methyl ester carboxylesterase